MLGRAMERKTWRWNKRRAKNTSLARMTMLLSDMLLKKKDYSLINNP
jgi:hypothetical protein